MNKFIQIILGQVKNTSGAFKLNYVDFLKLVRNGLIYGAGTALTFISQNLSGVDFGVYTPVVVMVISVVIDALRKCLVDNTTEVKK